MILASSLALFLLGLWSQRANGPGAVTGLATGLVCNLYLWLYAPDVSWLWWNVIGLFVGLLVGYSVSIAFPLPDPKRLEGTVYRLALDNLSDDAFCTMTEVEIRGIRS